VVVDSVSNTPGEVVMQSNIEPQATNFGPININDVLAEHVKEDQSKWKAAPLLERAAKLRETVVES